MTDRQTDTSIWNQRSQWWSVTCYGDNITIIENAELYPNGVKFVHGGREKCPDTGRDHFQGAVECNGQQRAAFFRNWLPGVHFEKARCKESLKKYALKQDTAIGIKSSIENPKKFFSLDGILLELGHAHNWLGERWIASVIEKHMREPAVVCTTDEATFWHLTIQVMRKHGNHLASGLANPAVRKMWLHTKDYWIAEARSAELEATPSITESLDNEVEDELEGNTIVQ